MKRINGILSLVILLAVFAFNSNIANAQVGVNVSMTGNIIDYVTKEAVTTKITVLNEEGMKVNRSKSSKANNGHYFIAGLKPGQKYFIVIEADSYFKEKYEVKIAKTDKYTEVSRDFLVKPLKKDVKIKVKLSPFELNKTKLRYGADFILKDLVLTLKENETVKFNILCYPDSDVQKAEKISRQRAEALRQFFINNGIDASRIEVEVAKSTDPDNPPPTEKRAKGKRYTGTSYLIIKSF